MGTVISEHLVENGIELAPGAASKKTWVGRKAAYVCAARHLMSLHSAEHRTQRRTAARVECSSGRGGCGGRGGGGVRGNSKGESGREALSDGLPGDRRVLRAAVARGGVAAGFGNARRPADSCAVRRVRSGLGGRRRTVFSSRATGHCCNSMWECCRIHLSKLTEYIQLKYSKLN